VDSQGEPVHSADVSKEDRSLQAASSST
jgi:hypothetical protein